MSPFLYLEIFMNDFQFYPTPLSLAQKAWEKFQNKDFVRILEPSAGNGDLLKGIRGFGERWFRDLPVDVCEIDISKHATLRSLPGVSVVGMDFMEFGGGAIYSHIIQNPPFAQGVQHVLKAWESLFDGEIVSIINAETLRNPFSRERQHLVRLIEQHGDVEFIEEAFVGDDVQRETKVEIALVYLRKQSNVGEDIVGSVLSGLHEEDEKAQAERLAGGYKQPQELMIPTTAIENYVMTFNAAVRSMRESVIAESRANYYCSLIGSTMAEITSESKTEVAVGTSTDWVKSQIAERYLNLKDRAWANLLRSSNVVSKLSSNGQKRMEAAFNDIKTLEFSVANVHGFLRGLMENQGDIIRQMACDVFDLICRYHTDNVVFYKGWVSNSKHRSFGMRLKKSRFVIPGNMSYSGSSNLSYEAERRLADFDRVLAMLDGKDQPDVSLVDVFRRESKALAQGERKSSSYLDVRFYPKAGTIHFFPRSQELMDKLNRLVGEYRQWLPPQTEAPSEAFMRQYNDADRFDKEFREELDAAAREKRGGRPGSYDYDHPLRTVWRDESERKSEEILAAMSKVHERHGIKVDDQLQYSSNAGVDEKGQQLLIAA
jgi:hypothetical protein